MIADMIHDLRTPLVAVRGYARMMLEERAGPLNSTQREYLTIMVENSNRMIRLLNDLGRLATEEPSFFEPIDVRDLWESLLRLWKPRAQAKSIQIQEKIPSQSLVVRGDRQKLTQVFEALLANAVKFTEPGGEIAVELSGGAGEEVQLRISGTGFGIPEGLADDFSGHSDHGVSTEHGEKKLDSGFSLVRDIIRFHGGEISATTEARGGSTLIFTLPA